MAGSLKLQSLLTYYTTYAIVINIVIFGDQFAQTAKYSYNLKVVTIMIPDRPIDPSDALLLFNTFADVARGMHVDFAIRIIGTDGEDLFSFKMHNTAPGSVQKAAARAHTAYLHKRDTSEFLNPTFYGEKRWTEKMIVATKLSDPQFTAETGGYAITLDGEILGFIGVAGGTVDEDDQVCQSAVRSWVDANIVGYRNPWPDVYTEHARVIANVAGPRPVDFGTAIELTFR